MNFPYTSIAIIGYGHFGGLLHEVFSRYCPDCKIGVVTSKDIAARIDRHELNQYEVIIPTVPLAALEETLLRIQEHMHPEALVREVGSIKKLPYEWIQRAGITNYLCTHPMFGPFSYAKKGKSLQDLRIVITEHTLDTDLFSKRVERFQSLGLHTIHMSSEEHDVQLAETLFLTHYIGQIVAHAGFDRTTIDTVSFGFLMDAVESVKEDKALFLDVRQFNPYCKIMLSKFHESQQEIERLLYT